MSGCVHPLEFRAKFDQDASTRLLMLGLCAQSVSWLIGTAFELAQSDWARVNSNEGNEVYACS